MTAAYASPAQDPALYDGVADHWWDDSVRWVRTLQAMVPARLRWFEAQGAVWDGLDVLDLGCAGGFMAEALARKGARVSGLDPADAAIAAARAHAAAEGLSVDFRAGVGEALPYADDAFDAVVCVDVLEHVSDLGAVLEEVRRVLRPGGRFCFDTINAGPLPAFAVVTLAENLLGLLPKGAHDPDLFIKPSHLRGALESLGFEVGPFRGLGPVGLNRRLDFVFGTHPLTSIIYIGTAKAPG